MGKEKTLSLKILCIFNENIEEYNVKSLENDVKYSNFNIEEMDKSQELYSREGNNCSRFEGKTVGWEHTIIIKLKKGLYIFFIMCAMIDFRQQYLILSVVKNYRFVYDETSGLMSPFKVFLYSLWADRGFVPPRGIFANIPHLKEHYIRNILSHVSTLAVGAFRIFGVKYEKLCKNHRK